MARATGGHGIPTMTHDMNHMQMPMVFGVIGAIYLLVNLTLFLSEAYIWQRKVKLKAKGHATFGEDAVNAGLAMAAAHLFHAGLMTLVPMAHFHLIAWSLTLTITGITAYSLRRATYLDSL
jgi:hypothetical protein